MHKRAPLSIKKGASPSLREASPLFESDKGSACRSRALAEIRCAEGQMQILAHRLVMEQETERSRLSLELHDHITQVICAAILRCQKLAWQLSGNEKAQLEALNLGTLMGQAAEEVERISRHLRPGVLETLGLVAAMRASIKEFAHRTGLVLTPALVPLTVTLPPEVDLALYRILQESLKNIERHAHARLVTVQLLQGPAAIQLTIEDDGVGFDTHLPGVAASGFLGVGLLGMRERASFLGGALHVESAPDRGTLIRAQIPFTPTGTPAPYAPYYCSPR